MDWHIWTMVGDLSLVLEDGTYSIFGFGLLNDILTWIVTRNYLCS